MKEAKKRILSSLIQRRHLWTSQKRKRGESIPLPLFSRRDVVSDPPDIDDHDETPTPQPVPDEPVKTASNHSKYILRKSGVRKVQSIKVNAFKVIVEEPAGDWTELEKAQLRKIIEEFCAAKQIPVENFASLKFKDKNRPYLRGALIEIAKSFPHRSVHSVYRRGLREFHTFRRGKWSEYETRKLHELTGQLGKKWVAIQNIIGRYSDDCRDKYRETYRDFSVGSWTAEDEDKLRRVICEKVRWNDGKFIAFVWFLNGLLADQSTTEN